MTDFFGGITNNFRSLGDDAASFLDTDRTSLYKAVAAGVKGSGVTGQNSKVDLNDGFIRDNQAGRSANDRRRQAIPGVASVDFNSVEAEWLQRIRRFAQLDKSTEVKEGSF